MQTVNCCDLKYLNFHPFLVVQNLYVKYYKSNNFNFAVQFLEFITRTGIEIVVGYTNEANVIKLEVNESKMLGYLKIHEKIN